MSERDLQEAWAQIDDLNAALTSATLRESMLQVDVTSAQAQASAMTFRAEVAEAALLCVRALTDALMVALPKCEGGIDADEGETFDCPNPAEMRCGAWKVCSAHRKKSWREEELPWAEAVRAILRHRKGET